MFPSKIRNYAFGNKFLLWSQKCLSKIMFRTLRKDAQIFERNFFKSSQGQRTKFTHLALITFAQYCAVIIYLQVVLLLTHCIHVFSEIGSPFERGLSGGIAK